jgi:molybdopterin synthase sulfur carrier subunit
MKILYFATIRSRLGLADEDVALPKGVATVGDLVKWQRDRGGAFAEIFRDLKVVRVAVNEEYAGPETRLGANDEVAFFPPVTGGAR